MIVLYSLLSLLVRVAGYLVKWRANTLAGKYARVTRECLVLVRDPVYKEGNSSRAEPYAHAKRQYLLGVLAQKKEKLEAKHYAWQERSDKLAAWARALDVWQGRKLPYLCGALDVVAGVLLLDYYEVSDFHRVRQLVEFMLSRLTS
jgi:hypothetical protein